MMEATDQPAHLYCHFIVRCLYSIVVLLVYIIYKSLYLCMFYVCDKKLKDNIK